MLVILLQNRRNSLNFVLRPKYGRAGVLIALYLPFL